MEEKDLLDYRPVLKLERDVESPLFSIDNYENPNKGLSSILSLYLGNKPSELVGTANWMVSMAESKMNELAESNTNVRDYIEADAATARRMVDSSISEVDGDAGVLAYDRLRASASEMNKMSTLILKCLYGADSDEDFASESDSAVESEFVGYELANEGSKINYEAMSLDTKLILLFRKYISSLSGFISSTIDSGSMAESADGKIDSFGKKIYSVGYKDIAAKLSDSRTVMNRGFDNGQAVSLFKKAYNCRTQILNLTDGMDSEILKKYEDRIKSSKAELTEEFDKILVDLYKAVHSQQLCCGDFSRGFEQKCNTLYELKGGI